MSRKESVRGSIARTQSTSEPPTMEFVKVAVLPPRLPEGMAPPTGVGAAEAFSWNERLQWRHNEKIDQPERKVSATKSFMRKAGITTQRKARNEELPPFTFREVPYDIWRKHYAKDKEGRYRGTHAPAEDCLLLPEDVEMWRMGEPETKADLWTRGKVALPVYNDLPEEPCLPEYKDIDDQPSQEAQRQASSASAGSFTADGKTSDQIIQEAKEKSEMQKAQPRNKRWKDHAKRGVEWGVMGWG